MTGAGDTSEIDEFTLDEAEDVADEAVDIEDDLEDDDESGTPVPPVGTDVQFPLNDPDPTAGASDIGGLAGTPDDPEAT
jgi:hypothetical protein